MCALFHMGSAQLVCHNSLVGISQAEQPMVIMVDGRVRCRGSQAADRCIRTEAIVDRFFQDPCPSIF